MAIKQTDAVLQAWLTRATGTGGPYDPAALFLGVATALVDNGALTTMSDVTEGTGDLADRVAVTAWSDPYKMNDGRWVVDGPVCPFAVASSSESQTVTHWFLNSASSAGTLKAYASLSTAVPLPDEKKQLNIIPRITIDPAGRF